MRGLSARGSDDQDWSSASLADTITELGTDGRLVHLEKLDATPGRPGRATTAVPSEVLDRIGVDHLWSHQADALDLIMSGRHTAVATGTGSGKSLIYQLAIASARRERVDPTALLIYPTKALANDQLRSFTRLGIDGLTAATHDGDSPPDHRRWVRRHANVVLTNPEMLHLSILPNHGRWSRVLSRLEVVVIDELHVLRGLFGTHVGQVLRRLRRVAEHHGAKPTFVFTSATIGDPAGLAGELIGAPVEAVHSDGSPRPERHVALWSGASDGAVTTSSDAESAYLASEFISRGHRTITFCRSRQGTERVAEHIRERLQPADADRVDAYRGGYLADERRDVEDQLHAGDLDGVVATSALELGIDVGDLDVAVVNGFPGTVASFRQQTGRVGRRGSPSLAVLVAGADQLDHWFMANPRQLFDREPERAVINPDNPHVLRPHLACAAHELPLTPGDDHGLWGDALDDGVRDLALVDLVTIRNRRAVWAGSGSPAREVSLRSGGGGEIRVVDRADRLVGTVDGGRATSQIHEGARYVHRGAAWRITALDIDACRATAVPDDRGKVRTTALSSIGLAIVAEHSSRPLGPWQLHLGEVQVTDRVTRYQVKDRVGTVLEEAELELPATCLHTTAFWVTIEPDVVESAEVSPTNLPGSLHAAEHAAIGVLPLFTICDRWDVGGVSTARHQQTEAPTIFIHDGVPGGAGIAQLGFDRAEALFSTTAEVIDSCTCRDGCPGCVVSPKCGNGNDPLDKAGALRLLRTLGCS